MFELLQSQLLLPLSTLAVAAVATFFAGVVRGFSGFGLSAFIMAPMALLVPPVALLPICFMLEATSSVLMAKGGMTDGDKKLAIKLVTAFAIGMPLGLWATHTLPPELSRLVVLLLILALSATQLLSSTPASLQHPKAVYLAGFVAGLVTGLAAVGAMVIALFLLSLDLQARKIRGTLVLFMFMNILISAFWLLISETLDMLAFRRAVFFMPLVALGVALGSQLFRPSLERYYKHFCLYLLMGLAGFGLVRLVFF